MYKLVKDKGYSNVFITNPVSSDSLNLGAVSVPMLDILSKAGFTDFKVMDEWDITLSEELKNELCKLAFRMNKPPKKEKVKPDNTKVDAMDVMLGLANYK